MYISQTGEDMLGQLPADITWSNTKRKLITRLGNGSAEEEAHNSLKQLSQGDKDIINLGTEAEKSVKRA